MLASLMKDCLLERTGETESIAIRADAHEAARSGAP